MSGAQAGEVLWLHMSSCRSDTQVVTGKSAEACQGLVNKQLASVGIPLWQDVVANLSSEPLVCMCPCFVLSASLRRRVGVLFSVCGLSLFLFCVGQATHRLKVTCLHVH